MFFSPSITKAWERKISAIAMVRTIIVKMITTALWELSIPSNQSALKSTPTMPATLPFES